MVLLCTALAMIGAPVLETAAFIMAFPLGILLVTARFGIGPAVFAAVVGVLLFDYVFVPPAMAFAVPNLKDGFSLALMGTVAGFASVLVERVRRQVRQVRRQ